MYIISCLRASGPLPQPLLTNPNPLHHPPVLPARNGQCRIHARPDRTRPLTGAGIEAARRPRERLPCRFLVHATAPRSKAAIASHNMHVKSSWESVLQLVVLPQLVSLFQWLLFVDHVDHAAPRAQTWWTRERPRKGTTRSRQSHISRCPC